MDQINKILFITLSNIGDAILTLPALDALKAKFPKAKVTVMAGPRPKELFENNPAVERVIVYDKHATLAEKIRLFRALKKERYDAVIDLRNTLYGALLPARVKNSLLDKIPPRITHMKDRHLFRLRRIVADLKQDASRVSLPANSRDEEFAAQMLRWHGVGEKERVIIISPGARSHTKRWKDEKFAQVINALNKEGAGKIILIGDSEESAITRAVAQKASFPVIDLAGKLNLPQLASLLRKASLVITNDSAVLHLASYVNTPVVGIFGISNDKKYGPWPDKSAVVKKELFCRPCGKAQCRFNTLKCMDLITTRQVVDAAKAMLTLPPNTHHLTPDFQRILIVRTDRIGDVLLSTPVIKAMRDAYPSAFIAMMVSPYAKEIVQGNSYLDEVIIYDKDAAHKSWSATFSFARNLQAHRFDLALILHPTNRAHLVTYFAGIKRRVGYDRKLGFLLTDKIAHTKQHGEKHESEYALDLVRYLGIAPAEAAPYMPISEQSEKSIAKILQQEGVSQNEPLVGIHPAASCPSKCWPLERFAKVADALVEKFHCKILVVAGPSDTDKAKQLIKLMRAPTINLAGKTSVSELASALKRCRLFISNDSGPVHIASAVGTPVIAIFGRSQKGLSPKRWGPMGARDVVLHKEVGCIECLAHNCARGFACLAAVSAEEVVAAAEKLFPSF